MKAPLVSIVQTILVQKPVHGLVKCPGATSILKEAPYLLGTMLEDIQEEFSLNSCLGRGILHQVIRHVTRPQVLLNILVRRTVIDPQAQIYPGMTQKVIAFN